MRIFGLTIERQKSAVAPLSAYNAGWSSLIREPFAGAWQRNIDKTPENVLTHNILYACVTLIKSDIAKLRIKLMEQGSDSIWTEIDVAAFSPVLRKPNHYQNRIQFLEQWVTSKLIHGNTYVLKERDNRGGEKRGVVVALYILDPTRVRPLVAPDGSVYYQLGDDNLAGLKAVTVPASEIIHDINSPLYHPLCGISPISACALAAASGLNIQEQSAKFFGNGSKPSGILTAVGEISQADVDRVKTEWETKYSGNNAGRVAVLGSGLTYAGMTVKATDAQLIEQLKYTGEQICSAFHVPGFMVGVGPEPLNNNLESRAQQYYSQCLQILIESIELLLDEGLGLTDITGKTYGTELDLEGLLRMDTASRIDASVKAIAGGLFATNEARASFDKKPVKGGDDVRAQQQQFSLAALKERDDAKPFVNPTTPPPALPAPPPKKDFSVTVKEISDSLGSKLKLAA